MCVKFELMASTPSHSADLLVQKLDAFIRKYYINSVIRGILYSFGLVLLLFLVVSLLEARFYFSPLTRQLLWYGFLGSSLLALGGWVVLPLLRYFRLGSTLSYEQAAQIIGEHFGSVKDKLLNVLQLRRQAGSEPQNSLLLASIDQKSAEISPVPFRSAIDLRHNRRYLKYSLPPLALLLIVLLAAPSLITDSTSRLIRNTEAFERPAPFGFRINERLEAVQYDNFELTTEVAGEVLPAEVFIEVDGYRYRMQRQDANTFTYTFNNVQRTTDFQLSATEVSSPTYTLDVLPKPSIAAFTVRVDYPDYLGQSDEVLTNVGDLTVPVGTQLRWDFDTENTARVDLRFGSVDTVASTERTGTDQYRYVHRALRNDRYTLYIGNDRLPVADSASYGLTVIPDQFPQISVEALRDSTDEKLLFFIGEASDDHGIRKLDFVYRLLRQGAEADEVRLPISSRSGRQLRYDHVLDLRNDLRLEPGDELTYYFEVFDNDGVNGSKRAKTAVMAYRMPTKKELAARAESNDSKIKDQLKQALDDTRELREDTKELREKMLQEKQLDWKQKKEVEKLAERQQQIQQQIEEARQAYEENLENQPPQENEQLQQKEEQLQELFEESVDQEMQQLMEEIQQLMEELNKDQTLETMEEVELSDEEAEAQLERMLELFKQLEVEKEMQDAIEQLEELAEQQQELAEETEQQEEGQPTEEQQQQQEQIQQEFEALKEQLEQTEQKNEELNQPMPLDTKPEEQEQVEQNMQEAQEQLQQQKPKEASQQQKQASEQMKKMAQQMQQDMQSMQQQSNQEDMAAIRQLLENLVDLSFDQEETMDQLSETTVNTPRYVELVQQQFQINNDFELVRDSLQALATRNFQIESFVTEKVTEIRGNLTETVGELEERHTPQAANLQQRAMTGFNDLALMLNESMEQMQQQMASQMQGQQQCQNPKNQGKGQQGGKPSENPGGDKGKGSQEQKAIGQDMEGLKEGLQQGQGGSSKEFAEMAARQAALRRALEEKQRQRQQGGEGKDGLLEELIEEMNRTEEDLVNKRLTEETLQRQQEILTKMLEHERAEREQKLDEERKSATAEQQRRELPPNLEEYLRQRRAEVERFQRSAPQLRPYYRSMVDEYFRSLGGE